MRAVQSDQSGRLVRACAGSATSDRCRRSTAPAHRSGKPAVRVTTGAGMQHVGVGYSRPRRCRRNVPVRGDSGSTPRQRRRHGGTVAPAQRGQRLERPDRGGDRTAERRLQQGEHSLRLRVSEPALNSRRARRGASARARRTAHHEEVCHGGAARRQSAAGPAGTDAARSRRPGQRSIRPHAAGVRTSSQSKARLKS